MADLVITATIDAPGRGPVGLAWDGRFLWNADYATGSIYQLDPHTWQPVKSILCPGNLSGLTWDGRSLWQALHDDGWLRCINPGSSDFDRTITLGDHGWLAGAAWDGKSLWVVSQQKGQLFALDAASGQVRQALPVPVAGGGLDYHDGSLWLGIPYPMKFDAQNGCFDWIGDEQHFAVLQLDPRNGREIGRYTLHFMPMGLAWVNDELWLSHAGGQKLHRARLS